MREKGIIRYVAGVVGAAAVLSACSAGEGAPEGWKVMHGGSVAVAHPKAWEETRPAGKSTAGAQASAVLRGAGGRPVGEITVWPGGATRRGVRAHAMTIDGRPAQQLRYVERAADGSSNRAVEITTTDSHGRPVLVRVTGPDVDGWPDELRQIVNSIDVS
ncbi:hypothetical protein C8250_026950 [Streptomyces sp. So13.3]|uniref:hypothetical protein n=1 Tax=Streptomyces sp. So13.3 TaxID=2136173 RepID=UPI001107436A|nr:hypothetical protein [Streptomyces sp. So13.3]QNA75049.1 hypothetical protein C8250_026950 [Streptomyces sp. So13.3]